VSLPSKVIEQSYIYICVWVRGVNFSKVIEQSYIYVWVRGINFSKVIEQSYIYMCGLEVSILVK
jgi:hypothetical protein